MTFDELRWSVQRVQDGLCWWVVDTTAHGLLLISEPRRYRNDGVQVPAFYEPFSFVLRKELWRDVMMTIPPYSLDAELTKQAGPRLTRVCGTAIYLVPDLKADLWGTLLVASLFPSEEMKQENVTPLVPNL